MTMRLCKHHQAGFTLIELSIVLVIIGLIIGGVLTGQQIIQNARVTKAINDIQAYSAQFQTYTQNYGAMPGDDSGALGRFPNAGLGATPGNGNGALAGAFDAVCTDPTTGTESCLIWADLRAAGLVKNQTPITSQPSNPFNGVYGFQNGAAAVITTSVLCLNNVPGPAALAIDTKLDDGVGNAGNMVGYVTGDANAAAVTSYNPANTYTVCMRM